MKKFILAALAAILSLSAYGCSSEPVGEVIPFNETFCTASEIVARIDSMGEASLENEAEIEAIFVDYFAMDESEREKVTNYETLAQARLDITKLYNAEKKAGDKIDRSQLLIGTYCFSYTGEDSVKLLADAGIDFVAGSSNNTEMLDLFEKYGVGAFVSAGYLGIPSWRGGNRAIDLHIEPSFTIEAYKEAVNASTFEHPAMWGLELVDEPHSDDLPFIGEEETAYEKVNPDKLVYINLYPNYGDEQQLGAETYAQHVLDYVAAVDTDYISYDAYNVDLKNHDNSTQGGGYLFDRAICNLKNVADPCRETGKDLWIVIQAGSWLEDLCLTKEQLQIQAYPALAFGAKVLNWACWKTGWFTDSTNMVDANNEPTDAYYNVQSINKDLEYLEPVYMRYTNIDTTLINGADYILGVHHGRFDFVEQDDMVLDQDVFKNIKVSNKTAVILAGYFEKNDGNGEAMMFVEGTDGFARENEDIHTIRFTIDDENAVVTAYYPDRAERLSRNVDGEYVIEIQNAVGIFVTVEHPAAEATAE